MVYMPLNMDCLTEWCHVNRKLLMLLPQIHPYGPFVAGQLYCPWTSFLWVWSQASSVYMFKHWIFYSALSVPACFLKETWSTSYSRSVRGTSCLWLLAWWFHCVLVPLQFDCLLRCSILSGAFILHGILCSFCICDLVFLNSFGKFLVIFT